LGTHRKYIPAVLIGLVLAGCGNKGASGGAPRQVAVAPRVTQYSASFCGLAAGGGHVAAPPAVARNPVTFWLAMNKADDTAHLAAQQLEYGREDLVGGDTRAAQAQFSASLGILKQAMAGAHATGVLAQYADLPSHLSDACASYVQALNEYRTGMATHDSLLSGKAASDARAGDRQLKALDGELQAGSTSAEASVTTVAKRALSHAHAVARAAAVRAMKAQQHRLSTLRTHLTVRITATVRLLIKRGLIPASLVKHGKVVVTDPNFMRWLEVNARNEAVQNRQIIALRSYIKALHSDHLMFRANVASMAGWLATGVGPWQPITYAQPVNGVTSEVIYGGLGASTYLAPFQNHRPEFAVEARIKLDGFNPDKDNNPEGFGVFVHSLGAIDLSKDNPGFLVGIFHVHAIPGAVPPQPEVTMGAFSPASSVLSLRGAAAHFDPGTDWHTYRLEVRDSEMRLVVDRKLVIAHFTSDDYYFLRGVGLFSIRSHIEVSGFKVVRLPPEP
jgi:hypothetical protein